MSHIELERKNAYAMKAMTTLHLLLMTAVFVFVYLVFYSANFGSYNEKFFNIISVIFYIVIYLGLAKVYSAYKIGMKTRTEICVAHLVTQFLDMVALYFVNVIGWFRYKHFRNPIPMLIAVLAQALITYLWTKVADDMYFKKHRPQKSIIIYRNKKDLKRFDCISNFKKQFEVIRLIENPIDNYRLLYSQLEGAEVIFMAGVKADLRNSVVKYCVANDVKGYFVPHVGDVLLSGAKHVQQFDTPIVGIDTNAEDIEYLFIKRAFDIIVSLIGIVVLSWLMIIIAIAIRISDGGPAIYKQVRLTKDGKKFRIYKFRSMRIDAEKDGVARLATEDDDRITPIGKFLRKCRLDELPQLFNILKGDMTIVGPRPERPEIAKQYEEVIPSFRLRLQVKAGLTGYAQVYGRYNTDPYDKLEMDLMYINKMNIFEDLALMFATVIILFTKESTAGLAEGAVTAIEGDEDFR